MTKPISTQDRTYFDSEGERHEKKKPLPHNAIATNEVYRRYQALYKTSLQSVKEEDLDIHEALAMSPVEAKVNKEKVIEEKDNKA